MNDKRTPPSNSSGTYTKSGNSSKLAGNPAEATHENRFAEVQRKSRDARAKLVNASQVRAADNERRAETLRSEAAERDRQDGVGRDFDERIAVPSAPTPRERAAAQLDSATTSANADDQQDEEDV
jgi:hypothetical protein